MAKKQQQKLSYGPNLGLVGGARDVALSEVAETSAGGQAFAMGLTQTVIAGLEEKKQREDKLDAWMDNLGGIENINLLDQGYNKEAVTEFLRNGRDEYAILAEEYERTKDRAVKDKMEEIKFSFQNLNNQLQGLAKERKDYADAYDKGQLVTLENGDERFVDMYTNKSAFGISANGDIGYVNNDGTYTKFKDVGGKWNVKNNIGETFTLQQNLDAKKLGEKNGVFYKDDIKNLYTAKFKETGPEGIMVMAKTDLTGDNEYILPNGQKASSMSFESMWSQGLLDDKFYEQIPKGTDSKWMYDKKNVDTLNDLISEYYTDVTKSSYDQGKKNYKDPNATINTSDSDKNKYFPINANYGSGVTGGVLNKLINDLDSGTIEIGGKTYNQNPNNQSWSSEDGDIKSGNDVLQHYYDAYGGDFAFYNDIRFSKFRGTKTQEEKLITSTTIEDIDNEIEEFFTDINMLDDTGKYVSYERQGLDKVFGGSDMRMGAKNSKALKNKINDLLDQAGVSEVAASTAFGSPNSISLNGKNYTFKEGNFDYNALKRDLAIILKESGNVGQIDLG
tara:strand:+ start:31 stop:1713 length:1683 start_codon:yes stop_codon:yes gene_type:complete